MKVIYILSNILVDENGDPVVDENGDNILLSGWTGEVEVATNTLFDLTYMVARELDILEESTATAAGNTLSLIDTYRDEDDDYFNGGTLWLVRDAGGVGDAPEGTYAVVQDYAQGTGTFTLRSALGGSTAVGDKYAVATKKITLEQIVQAINVSLMDLKTVPTTDITSLTTATDQTEYTLPLAAKEDLREVWLQLDTTDSNDNRWMKLYNWYVQQAATGTQATLVFPYQPLATAYDLKLVYMSPHPELHVYDQQMSEFIPAERVIYPAVLKILRRYRSRVQGRDDWLDDQIEKYEGKVAESERMYPIPIPARMGKIMLVNEKMDVSPTFEANKVRL